MNSVTLWASLEAGRLSYSKWFSNQKACTVCVRKAMTDHYRSARMHLSLLDRIVLCIANMCTARSFRMTFSGRVHRRTWSIVNRTDNNGQRRTRDKIAVVRCLAEFVYTAASSGTKSLLGQKIRSPLEFFQPRRISQKRSYTLHLRIEIWLLPVFLDFLRNGDAHESVRQTGRLCAGLLNCPPVLAEGRQSVHRVHANIRWIASFADLFFKLFHLLSSLSNGRLRTEIRFLTKLILASGRVSFARAVSTRLMIDRMCQPLCIKSELRQTESKDAMGERRRERKRVRKKQEHEDGHMVD